MKSLGIPRGSFRKLSVCEFGPGTGQNIGVLINAGCRNITLVDGSQAALKTLHRLKQDTSTVTDSFVIEHCNFIEYSTDIKYDLVIAEGCIPHQADPIKVLRVAADCVGWDGILVVSTISGLSHASETIRRLISSLLVGKAHPDIGDLEKLGHFFEVDLSYLSTKTRPTTDWCLDVIIQPLYLSKLMSQVDALEHLDGEFRYYASLPTLISPYYWYKDYSEDEYRERLRESYFSMNLSLVSRNIKPFMHTTSDGKTGEELGEYLWIESARYQRGECDTSEIRLVMDELGKLYMKYDSQTSEIFNKYARLIKNFKEDNSLLNEAQLRSFWGRGQQYISFERLNKIT